MIKKSGKVKSIDAVKFFSSRLLKSLSRNVLDMNSTRDPLMLMGTAVSVGNLSGQKITHFPEIDLFQEMAPNAKKIYVVEPDNAYFKDLATYAGKLPPDMQKRMILVNEKANHLRWVGPDGIWQGVSEGVVGLCYANLVFTKEIIDQYEIVASLKGVTSVLKENGILAVERSDLLDYVYIDKILQSAKLREINPGDDYHLLLQKGR